MIQLRLLGALEVRSPDGTRLTAVLRRSKGLALLAYLTAARPRGTHRRDKIAALFWPELESERARAALRVTLTRLREDLGDIIVSSGNDEIGVDASRVWCDVVALDECIARGDALAAADYHRGLFLDGVHVEGTTTELEHWMSAERARIRADVRQALATAAASDRANAVQLLRRAADIAPEDETVGRALVDALIASGDRGGALRAYETLSATLEREFGVAPSPETRAQVETLPPATSRQPRVSPPVPRGGDKSRPPEVASRWLVAMPLLAVAALLVGGGTLARGRAAASALPAARWALVKPAAGPVPRGRLGREAVMDSTGNAILVFGGVQYGDDPATSTISNELWRLQGLRAGETVRWTRVVTSGFATPAPRWLFGMVNDPAGDRAIVHGGAMGYTAPCATDTWILRRASGSGGAPEWTRVVLRGDPPPARAGIHPVYDAASRRLIVIGGTDCIATFFNDVWVLQFSDSSLRSGSWSRLMVDSSAGAPVGRSSYAAGYDAASNRLFLHGGERGKTIGELWVLDHANGLGGTPAWHALTCGGTAPLRTHEAALFDAAGGTLTLFGGTDAQDDYESDVLQVTGLLGNLRACRWGSVPASQPGPSARGSAVAMADVRQDVIAVFGGEFQTTAFSDAWLLSGARRR